MNRSSLVSVIVPVYNETEALPELIAELSKLETNRWGDTFEFVLVDDGSTDDTWEKLLQWAEHEPRLSLVRLAGNRGAHRAVRAGLEAATGDVMVMIPADLQEGIDLVELCLDKWHRSGTMVVMMVPKHGRVYERRLESLAAGAFYWVLRAGTGLYKDASVRAQVKLMDRVAADAFTRNSSAYALRAPFVLQQRFPYEVVHYEIKKRSKGRSKWDFAKKTALMVDMLVDTSAWLLSPWRIAAAGFATYACLMLASLTAGSIQPVLTSLAGVLLAATLLSAISILGIQVARICQELRGRPLYVIREIRRSSVNVARSRSRVRSDSVPPDDEIQPFGAEITPDAEKKQGLLPNFME